jgi:hypothetical protein
MPPLPPFWFHQRQAKMEPAGTDIYRLIAPNAPEGFISIRSTGDGRWAPVFRTSAEGPDLAQSHEELGSPKEAWEAAFELYRRYCLV